MFSVLLLFIACGTAVMAQKGASVAHCTLSTLFFGDGELRFHVMSS
jgi:cytosine/adenosine deaminase-related metal-dependent hydrolase